MGHAIRRPSRLLLRTGLAALAFFASGAAALADAGDAPSTPDGWHYAWHALRSRLPLKAAPSLVAYVVDADANRLTGYEVDAETGLLSPLTNASVQTQEYPFSVAAHPSGRFIYVTNLRSNSISAFGIDGRSGGLRALPDPVVATGAMPWAIAMHPSGRFAYVLNAASRNIVTYAVDPVSGALAASSSLNLDADTAPMAMAAVPDGRFVYVAMAGNHRLVGYAVDPSTGALHRLPALPLPLANAPESVMADASGNALHVLLSSGDLLDYAIDPAQGGLTPVPHPAAASAPSRDHGQPHGLAALAHVCALPSSWPRGIATDPDTRHAFVVREGSRSLLTYALDTPAARRDPTVQSRVDAGVNPVALTLVALRP